jgi:hypothetical protein
MRRALVWAFVLVGCGRTSVAPAPVETTDEDIPTCTGERAAGASCDDACPCAATLTCNDGVCALPRELPSAGDFCGDGKITSPEVCDTAIATTCADVQKGPGTVTCSSDCSVLDTSGCSALCGNGVREDPEPCDGRIPPDVIVTCADDGCPRPLPFCSASCELACACAAPL